jgi:hypothetical protein
MAFCAIHGLFRMGSAPVLGTNACPVCGRQGGVIPQSFESRLIILIDPDISLQVLITLRQIAESLKGGLLTAEEAQNAASRLSPKFSGIFQSLRRPQQAAQVAAAVIEATEAILTARSKYVSEKLSLEESI